MNLLLAKKFLELYWTQRFVILFVKAYHLSLSWASWMHSTWYNSALISALILSSHIHFAIPSGRNFYTFPYWKTVFLLLTNLMHFFMYVFIHFISLHVSSITVLIIRRSNCINTSYGMISLCKWLLGMPFRHTKKSHRLIILDDVLIPFDLLMMSTMMFETCRDV